MCCYYFSIHHSIIYIIYNIIYFTTVYCKKKITIFQLYKTIKCKFYLEKEITCFYTNTVIL
jgi:hypothetical protein